MATTSAHKTQPTLASLRRWLAMCEAIAREAGERLVRTRRTEAVITAQPQRDVKLRADRDIEAVIIAGLREQSPFAILTEERGALNGHNHSDGLRWIVDPLDGSLNYTRGIPFCCVSIALWDLQGPLLGVVYDFNHDEMFTGLVGRGAWLNRQRIGVSRIRRLDQAVLGTGLPAQTDFSAGELKRFVKRIRHYQKVRWLGSAALSLAYVAAGRTDAYYERDINLWDVAAGLAIVQGAGGQVVWHRSATSQNLTVSATNASASLLHSIHADRVRGA